MNTRIIKFIKNLPDRERIFYLLMRAYEHDFTDLSQIYEHEILRLLGLKIIEKSSDDKDEFVECGEWASPFSED